MTGSTVPPDRAWLGAESRRLLDFGRGSVLPGAGFGWLDAHGQVTPGAPQHLYVAGRMTHAFALGHLLGVPGCAPVVDHGIRALTGIFRDAEHGGWFTSLDEGSQPLDTRKDAYAHTFVVLAGASAAVAGRPGGRQLLDAALTVVDAHFWDERSGAVVEQWDRTFATSLDYRGLNSAMHMLEAYLAAYSVTEDASLLDRGSRLAHRAVDAARRQGWRLPEHFTTDWDPVLDFNSERRDDPFKPYGSTVGHWFEWSRLLLLLEAAHQRAGHASPWMREASLALFQQGTAEGWRADGRDGFVYTVDWDGRPAVHARLHWVVAEAIGAAATLHAVTGDEQYLRHQAGWWAYARRYLVDEVGGSWHHELDDRNRPSSTIKQGKADIYHALQATLLPCVPVRPSMAQAVADADPV